MAILLVKYIPLVWLIPNSTLSTICLFQFSHGTGKVVMYPLPLMVKYLLSILLHCYSICNIAYRQGICHVSSVGEWQPIVVIEIFLRRHSVMRLKCIWLGVLQATLQWHHNERDGVSNHQPHGFLLNRLFKRRSEETSKLLVTGLYAGNSLLTVEFPAQRPITRKMFLFDDVVIKIMLPLSYQSLPTALSTRKIFFSYIYVSINVPE